MYFFLSFFYFYTYNMPDFAGSKTQNHRCRQGQRGSKTKKGTNATANPSYVSKKISLPQLLYIVCQIFRRVQIFVGFFRSRGRSGAAGKSSANTTTLFPAKKKRRLRGTSGFRVKTSVYRDYFQVPAACTHSYQPHQF